MITAEYSTGMIRASMTAVPRRLPVLWAKAIVYGLVTLALTIPATLIAFVVGESIFKGRHINIAFSHPGRRARRDRCRALSHRRRPVRPGTGRDRPEHGRRHRDVRRDHVPCCLR